MKYQPELAVDDRLLPHGKYEASIIKADDAISKSRQRDMLSVDFLVSDSGGSVLVSSHFVHDVPFSLARLRDLCLACGHDWASGCVTSEDLLHHSVILEIKTAKSKDPKYPNDKNEAVGFFKSELDGLPF